jgi:hypothetical protein
MRMVSGAEAIILPIAASHWNSSTRDRAAGSSPGSTRAVANRGLPWQPAAAAGGLSSANARGATPARKAWRISRLLPRSRLVTRRYFRDRISPVVPPPAAKENVRSATRGRAAERAGRWMGAPNGR